MISLVIGLTSDTVRTLMDDVTKYNAAKDRIFQHKILMTDILDSYYLESFDEPSDKQAYRYWADKLERDEKFKFYEMKSKDPIEEINKQLEELPHHICICYSESEIETGPVVNKITLNRINTHGDYNELSKFCFPLVKIIREGESRDEFIEWLHDVLKDEKKVTLIDRYICKPGNEGILKDVYFPIIPDDSRIVAHFGCECYDQVLISAIKRQYGERVTMTPSNPNDFHDRYILCEKFYVSLGVGLDVFENGKARKESQEIVSDGDKPRIPRAMSTSEYNKRRRY